MHKEYPEDIDQLDSFYQQELADVEVPPPADMWDRISASYDKEQNKKGFVIPFSKTQKRIIGIILLALLFSLSTYVYLRSDKKSTPPLKENTPALPHQEKPDRSHGIDQKEQKSTLEGKDRQVKETSRTLNSSNNKQDHNKKINPSSTALEKDNHTEPQQELKAEPVNKNASENTVEETEQVVEKAPKKKVSFKDKYKKDYQDSTRNLFVPSK